MLRTRHAYRHIYKLRISRCSSLFCGFKSAKIQIEPNRSDKKSNRSRIESGVAKTDSEPDQTESFRGVIESFYDHSVEMIYSSRDDFFHIYWYSRSSRSQRTRRLVCDSDEIRSKWQRSSKTSWSEEKSFVTTEDLDSQRDLDESWDERSVNEIVEREFLYNEMNFLSRLNRQQLAIHSFVSQ